MALLYRAVLRPSGEVTLAQLTSDLQDWLREEHDLVLPASGDPAPSLSWVETSGGQAEEWAARLELRAAEDDLVTVTACGSGGMAALLLVERTDPVALGHEPPDPRPAPNVVRYLLRGGLWGSAAGLVDGTGRRFDAVELRSALELRSAPECPPLVLLSTPADGEVSPRVFRAMQEHLLGAAEIVRVRDVDLEGPARSHGLRAQGRAGSVMLVIPTAEGPRVSDLPATVVRTQPVAAARRAQAAILTQLAARPLPGELVSALRELTVARGRVENVDDLVDDLIRREEAWAAQRLELLEQLSRLTDDLQVSWLELQEALDDRDEAQRRARYLDARLRELGEFPVGDAVEDEFAYLEVTSCEQVLDLASESLRWVEVTANREPARALDRHEKAQLWARKAWGWLRALDDYGRVKAEGLWHGGLASYCVDPPSGVTSIPSAAFAPRESESTESSPPLVEARTFPVPPVVDALGQVFMPAHLKIDRGGSPAPRLHLYDDTGGSSGRVHIGYFGPHLPTADHK